MSGSSVTVGSIQVVARVDDRDAGEHVRDVDPVAERRCGGGELDACVDALGLAGIVRDVDDDPVAVHRRGRARRRSGTARPGRCRAGDGRAPARADRPEDVDRRVRLTDLELLGRRVTCLDDRLEVAVRARARSARSFGCRPGTNERTVAPASRERCVSSSASSRSVVRSGVSPERMSTSVGAGQRALGAADCVARAERLAPARPSTRPSNASAVSGETTTTSGSAPSGRAASTTQSTIRRPRIGWRCFGVAERMRVPRPPAMTTAASVGRDSDTVGTLAGAPGFEPGITGPKPVALPLGHAPVNRDAECTRT